jgi:hypothetical protein
MTHNWRRFSAIPFSAIVAEVLDALELEPPPEGRPTSFQAWDSDPVSVHTQRDRETGALYSTIYANGGSRLTTDRGEIRRAMNLSAGTPSGKALRRYLDWWYPEQNPDAHRHRG